MFDYNLKVPVSVYQEIDAHERVSPRDIYYHRIRFLRQK